MKFTVDRSKWYRGKGGQSKDNGCSALLRREDGQKCCFGFYCSEQGFSDKEILGLAYPWCDPIRLRIPKWVREGHGDNFAYFNSDVFHAVKVNDDPTISDADRERLLTEIFARNGDEVIFTDGEIE